MQNEMLLRRGAPGRARDRVVPAQPARSTSRRETQAYRAGIAALADAITAIMPESQRAALRARVAAVAREDGVPAALARAARGSISWSRPSTSCGWPDDAAQNVLELGRRFFAIGSRFRLDALRVAARKLDGRYAWQKLAVAALIEDLYAQQAELTAQGRGARAAISISGCKATRAILAGSKRWCARSRRHPSPTSRC